MKKLFIILLFTSLISFGQDKINLNIDKKIEVTTKRVKSIGLVYKGSGIYTYGVWGSYMLSRRRTDRRIEAAHQKLKTKLIKEVDEFTARNNYNYKIILLDKTGTEGLPRLIMHFKVTNKDGSEVIFKSDAKKQLLELKEYLDLGIITQDEFDKKAVSLKKILFSN